MFLMSAPPSVVDNDLEHDDDTATLLRVSHSDLVRGLPEIERRGSDGL